MKKRSTLGSIPQVYRNLRRWADILAVLSKYGLADWISRTNIDLLKNYLRAADGEALARTTTPARIRMALAELGPTFIKFGQLLSTRPDLVGAELATELQRLQNDTPQDSPATVRQTIETDQQQTLEQLFAHFDSQPIASASIGQVHRATLHDGQEVVVKVRHAGIDRKIETDLDILAGLATLASRLEDFRNYQPQRIVADMSRLMLRELDFTKEQMNLLLFRRKFARYRGLRIPEPVASHCSPRMLTMSRLDGVKLSDLAGRPNANADPGKIARRGASLYLKMIFGHGVYHADPHPGNILVLEDGAIGLLDFGQVGRISERLREDIEALLVAMVNQDSSLLVSLIQRIGNCPPDLDEDALTSDANDFVGQYSAQSAADFDVGAALNDFMSLVRNYNITLPSEASLLIKALVTLEGTGKSLAPGFSLMELMKPLQRGMVLRRLSPARQMRRMNRWYLQLERLADRLPSRLASMFEQMQRGKFDIHLDHRRLGPTVNRLVVGLMTSALFLGSALMLAYKVPPLWFAGKGPWGIHDLSLLGLTGCIVSFLMGFRLLWAIRKSGNLDQAE